MSRFSEIKTDVQTRLASVRARVESLKEETFAGQLVTKIGTDNITDQAAMLAYYLLFSFVPLVSAVIAIMSMAGVFYYLAQVAQPLLNEIFPPQTLETLSSLISQVDVHPSFEVLALITALVPLLWSASQYLAAFGRATDVIYGLEETPANIILRVKMLVVLIILIVLGVLSIAVMFGTNNLLITILAQSDISEGLLAALPWLRYPLLFALLVVALCILYISAPADFTPSLSYLKKRRVLPGALVATIGALIGLWTLTQFVSFFGSFDARYGAFAGVIVLILSFWLVNTVFLAGVELNFLLEQKSQGALGDKTTQNGNKNETALPINRQQRSNRS